MARTEEKSKEPCQPDITNLVEAAAFLRLSIKRLGQILHEQPCPIPHIKTGPDRGYRFSRSGLLRMMGGAQ